MPSLPPNLIENLPKYQIETPNGFEPFFGMNKIERDWYIHLIFSDENELKCSPRHPLIRPNGTTILAMELQVGDKVKCKAGNCEVVYSEVVDEHIELYDIVNSGKDHLYYANDIVSHNCEFVGSVNTLINASKLKTMPFKSPIHVAGDMHTFEEPKENHVYTIVVDVSHGEGLDFSAFSVIDSGQFPYRQVARYQSAAIAPMAYPTVIQNAALKYNSAFVFVEVNDIGQQVADILHHDLEYDNMMMVTTRGRAGQVLGAGFGVGQAQLGIKTSKKVKQIGCMNLKNLIEADKFIIEDFDTIAELTSFVARGSSYEADAGHNDDLVMTLVLFAWLTTQPHFKELTSVDARVSLLEEKLAQAEEEVIPFGFIVDGSFDKEEVVVDRGNGSWLWENEGKPKIDPDRDTYH
jgi:hypothetical protein